MSRLDSEPQVISLVRALGLEPGDSPVRQALAYCHTRIESWLAKQQRITTLTALEDIVCEHLSLEIEEIWTDDDLATLTSKYISAGETVFAVVRDSFDEKTFATLVECSRKHSHGRRYVAAVDCRGAKANRRFFTRWHEIAHVLTLTTQLELPFHRSTAQGDSLERLMDVIAGDIGFYDSILRPVVERAIDNGGRLSFACVEQIRQTACPTASFQATLIACARLCPTPIVQVNAQLGFKVREEQERESPQMAMFPSSDPRPKLRAVVATANHAARALGLRIDKNMEIPDDSIVALLYNSGVPPVLDVIGTESLSLWKHSDGTSVGDSDVVIEARRFGDCVVALVDPLSRKLRGRDEGGDMKV